jgi:hypothetical protein
MTTRTSGGNWVDRDEPLEEKLLRVLAHTYRRELTDRAVLDWCSVLRGMVEADASEVQVSSYLASLPGAESISTSDRRLLAIALWHIAKAGLVRDSCQRRVAELMPHQPPQEPLSTFLDRAIRGAPDHNDPTPGT